MVPGSSAKTVFILLSLGLTLLFPAYEAQAQTRVIANWDMVPYQTFDKTIKVGVVAFHETGANVEF